MSPRRRLVALVGASSYGFAIGSIHSTTFALRNLVKMPLLLVVTALVCSLAYFVFAGTLTRLSFGEVFREASSIFEDVAILLSSLAPPMFFLARVLERPDEAGLHEYELFLVVNVVAIAIAGCLAVVRRAATLRVLAALDRRRTVVLLAGWLGVSLLVGSQWAWYLRPFCGVATVPAPFILGTEPDFRGDRSFFEALAHAIRR